MVTYSLYSDSCNWPIWTSEWQFTPLWLFNGLLIGLITFSVPIKYIPLYMYSLHTHTSYIHLSLKPTILR